MATRTVQNILQHPGTGAPIAGRQVKIRLNVPGFTSSGTIEKAATRIVTTDATGLWTCALEVNADIDPGGTWYTVQEVQGVIWTFAVPAGAGAINLRDCLITNPANPNPILSTVTSVNGQTGVVILDAAAVGADAAGAAAAAQAAAIAAAATDATTKVATETARATTAEGLKLAKASNLSDLANAATARTNLGLGTAATQDSTAFDAAGAAAAAQAFAIQRANHTGTETAGGDLSGTLPSPTVAKVNGVALSGLATGVLKNTTGTGAPSIAAAADIPTVAAGSTGPLSATDATTTNSRAPSGSASGDLSGTYPSPGVAKLNGTSLAGLGTGLLKNTTGTGVPSIAVAADVPVVAAGGTGPLSASDATTTNSRAPSGSAAGDLSGTYPSPGVAKLNGTSLAGLGTGLLKNTTGTGVPSIAVGSDIPNIAESQVTNLTTDLAAKATTTALTAISLIPTATKTANYTAVAGDMVMVDATSGPITVTAPALAAGVRWGIRLTTSTANVVTASTGSGTFDTNGLTTLAMAAGTGTALVDVTFAGNAAATKWVAVTAGKPNAYLSTLFPQLVNNLSDLPSVATARTNLGLGGAAVLNVGTATGTVAAGDDSRFTSLATPDAGSVGYDPSTSTGYAVENGLIPDGAPILGAVAASDVQGAIDDLNRKTFAQDISFYSISIRDTLRRVYPLVGSAPTTATGELVPGIAPLGASRTVPVANLATGTPNGSKFLRDDGTWAAPSASATRTWQQEPGDQNLKAMVSDPNAFQNTATLLAASTCYALRVWLAAATYTNYVVHCQTVGATLAANLYAFALANADATGTLVASSGTADAASVWGTIGVRTIALGTPFVNSTAGWFYILCQTGTATTQPKVSTGAAHALANIGLAQGTNVAPNAATAPKWGTTTTGFTGLTPPATTGNIIEGGSTLVFFAGLS